MRSIVSLFLAGQAAAFSGTVDHSALFSEWKKTHGKVYDSAAKEAKAFTAFAFNEEKIAAHNSMGLSYTLGHNEFSDLTSAEFFSMYTGYNASLARASKKKRPLHVYNVEEKLPNSIDWVASGAVTPVKNQGRCGSCWAFSTTGAIEGAYQIASGSLVSLSEEELVQCDDNGDMGCNGGLMDNAFTWVESHGLAKESAYPYTSGTGIRGLCSRTKENEGVVTVSGFTDVRQGDEDALRSALAKGPVSIAIEADKSAFQLYKSGVLDSSFCGQKLDHAVLLVGYGTDASLMKDYWKVKNSWGPMWGEEGYIRMAYGKNMCGIALSASYPTGAKPFSS